jgi:hypothetical protein
VEPATLAAAANIVVPACLVLQSKGYRVDRTEADKVEFWIAERSGLRFVADGPIELLGVVAVYEARGDRWRASDEDIDAFQKRFYPHEG